RSVRWPARRSRMIGSLGVGAIVAIVVAVGLMVRATSNDGRTSTAGVNASEVPASHAPTDPARNVAADTPRHVPPAQAALHGGVDEAARSDAATRAYVIPSELPVVPEAPNARQGNVGSSKDARPSRPAPKPSSEVQAKPDCSMPYAIDKRGVRRFRAECL